MNRNVSTPGLWPTPPAGYKQPCIFVLKPPLGGLGVTSLLHHLHQISLAVRVLPNKTALSVLETIKASIRSMPGKVHTLTFDNDMSFALHYELHKEFKVKTYFTRPYTSQDKGTVENRIGVIRRFIPKKTDLRNVTYENVQTIESLINNRPVRKFNYLSPYQITHQPIFCTY